MLVVVTAPAKGGKTSYLLSKAKQLTLEGKRCVFVVPEQVSFCYERLLCASLSGKSLGLVSVKSFRSLCRDVFKLCGGGAKPHADDAVRVSLMRRAAQAVSDNILYYKRHIRSSAFFTLALSAVEELKRSGVSPARLAQIAAEQDDSAVRRAKFTELSYLYAAYEGLLCEKYTDETTELADARELAPPEFFEGVTYLFDEFDSFSATELDFITAMLTSCDDAYFALCCDGERGTSPYYELARGTAATLRRVAVDAGADAASEVFLGEPHFGARGLSAVCAYLTRDEKPSTLDGVRLCEFADVYSEAEGVAAEIMYLAREKGYSYSEIAVVCNDLEGYRPAITEAFSRFGVPFFCDFKTDLLSSPLCVMACCALEILAHGISAEPVLRLLKTGLCDLPETDIYELEDYAFVWNVEYSDWKTPFTNNPDGYEQEWNDELRARLARIEEARARVVGALEALREKTEKARGDVIVREVWTLCSNLGAEKMIAALDEGDDVQGEQVRQFNMCSHLFAQLDLVLRDDEAGAADVLGCLRLLAGATKLYSVPNTLDGVLVGAADRTRIIGARAVFVLGAAQGLFPREEFSTGFFTDADVDCIEAKGVSMQTALERKLSTERARFISALTAADEALYISYPRRGADGSVATLSAKLRELEISDSFLCMAEPEPLIAGEKSALWRYARECSKNNEAAATISDALKSVNSAELAKVTAAAQTKAFGGAGDAARRLYSNGLYLSPSAVESFYSCRFSYFMRYIMRVTPLKKSELGDMQSGTFYHSLVESVVRELGDSLPTADEAKIRAVLAAHTARYIDEVMGGAQANSPRILYIAKRLEEQLNILIGRIVAEQAQSRFKIDRCELAIGEGGAQPRVLTTPTGENVTVVGKIDRVDVMHTPEGDYIRVVDYKTSGKAFSLSDVYYGLSLQMLIYLFSVSARGNGIYDAPIPAGVLYLPVDPIIKEEKNQEKAFVMDGLVLNDEQVIKGMERDGGKLFIPVDKTATESGTLASLERMGAIRRHVDKLLIDLADAVYGGSFDAKPLVKKDWSPCERCDYGAACPRYKDVNARVALPLKNKELFIWEDA